MKWIPHHNPDLVILGEDGRTEKERIDLQGLTAKKLESLLESLLEPLLDGAAGAAFRGAAQLGAPASATSRAVEAVLASVSEESKSWPLNVSFF